jgi:hypothetical protein
MVCTPMPNMAVVQGRGPLTRDGHGSAFAVPDEEGEQVSPTDQAWSRGLYGPLHANPLAGERPSCFCGGPGENGG